jgi:hypothetical protein
MSGPPPSAEPLMGGFHEAATSLFPGGTYPVSAFGYKGWCVSCPGSRQRRLFHGLVLLEAAKKTRKTKAYAKPAEPIRKQEQLAMGSLLKLS